VMSASPGVRWNAQGSASGSLSAWILSWCVAPRVSGPIACSCSPLSSGWVAGRCLCLVEVEVVDMVTLSLPQMRSDANDRSAHVHACPAIEADFNSPCRDRNFGRAVGASARRTEACG